MDIDLSQENLTRCFFDGWDQKDDPRSGVSSAGLWVYDPKSWRCSSDFWPVSIWNPEISHVFMPCFGWNYHRYPGLLLYSSHMFIPKNAQKKAKKNCKSRGIPKTSIVSISSIQTLYLHASIKDLGDTQRQWTPPAGTPRRQWKRCAGATGAGVMAFGAATAVPLVKLWDSYLG